MKAQAERTLDAAEEEARAVVKQAQPEATEIIAKAKDRARKALTAAESSADERRAELQRELEHLTRQRDGVQEQLDKMRAVFGG
jgi:F0F1-type ATP synthase membrane subunit b/b'